MNATFQLVAIPVVLLSGLAGCVHDQDTTREIDGVAFQQFFADQNRCMAFMQGLMTNAVEAFSHANSPEEMRAWVAKHPDDPFAALVDKVRGRTMHHGPLDPRNEADQTKVASQIWPTFHGFPGFEGSRCGANAHEVVMEVLIRGIGGSDAKAVQELHRRGVKDSWQQKWVLMSMLMAGQIKSD